MPPAKLDYTTVTRKTNKRTGKKTDYWYVRHPAFDKLEPIPGMPGEPAFHREYAKLLDKAGVESKRQRQAKDERSLQWLTDRYLDSPEYRTRKPNTQRFYRYIIKAVCEIGGDLPYAKLTKKGVASLRNEFADETPRKANGVVQVLSLVMSWAIEAPGVEDVEENRILGASRLSYEQEAFEPWSEPQIALFRKEAPPHLVRAVDLALNTGQRLSDCASMKRSRYMAGVGNHRDEVRVIQKKTGKLLDIAASSALKAMVEARDALEIVSDYMLFDGTGRAYGGEAGGLRRLSGDLRTELDRLGLDTLSFHGLRYAAAARLQDMGCSIATITAILGHRTFQMAMKYLSGREESERAAQAFDDRDD